MMKEVKAAVRFLMNSSDRVKHVRTHKQTRLLHESNVLSYYHLSEPKGHLFSPVDLLIGVKL